MNIKETLVSMFKNNSFTLKEAYEVNGNYREESVRARIYENIGDTFERIGRGIYKVISINDNVVVIDGDGRDLSFLNNNSIDCIIADHPWKCNKSHSGGNKSFANYDSFQYTVKDFLEKSRVLKPGSFLVEFLPEENEDNYEYLFHIKNMALSAGLFYYTKVSYRITDSKIRYTGRKAKNGGDIIIFSKGEARPLRHNAKTGGFMSGTSEMLPVEFNTKMGVSGIIRHESEKPLFLIEQILELCTKSNEIVLDQYAGSGVTGIACLRKNRKGILIEKSKECVTKILDRISYEKYKLNGQWI